MLRFTYRMTKRNMPKAEGPGSGPQGRINKLRKLVTALVRYERIEGKHWYLDESRGYAERLIQEAQKHGDQDKKMMEVADYWLLEKDLIHKLFKVLVPRYNNYFESYTSLYRLPDTLPGGMQMGILELKGNPWPPVIPKEKDYKNSLVNVLLEEARKDYRREKFRKMSEEAIMDQPDMTRESVGTNPSVESLKISDLHIEDAQRTEQKTDTKDVS